MQCEIDSVRIAMSSKGFSGDLYQSALNAAERALCPLNLSTTWGPYRNELQGQAINAIGFCAEILPDEEAPISNDDVQAVLALVVEVEALLEISTLPPHIRGLIAHQLNLIHTALRQYKVRGVFALGEAAWTAAGAMSHAEQAESDSSRTLLDEPEVQRLRSLWARLNGLADGAVRLDSLAQLGERVVEMLKDSS
jgi:hypothetical protein